MELPMQKIIFACVHNAGRSQMAAAFFNKHANPRLMLAISAGTEPANRVHPEVLAVMLEVGFDLSRAQPRKLDEALCKDASLLVTMGCGEKCPYVPGLEILDWPLPDPKGQSLDTVRLTRDRIELAVLDLIAKISYRLLNTGH
jgi:protein-tyrosine-phosphatase